MMHRYNIATTYYYDSYENLTRFPIRQIFDISLLNFTKAYYNINKCWNIKYGNNF